MEPTPVSTKQVQEDQATETKVKVVNEFAVEETSHQHEDEQKSMLESVRQKLQSISKPEDSEDEDENLVMAASPTIPEDAKKDD